VYDSDTNHVDNNGKKQGFWRYCKSKQYYDVYYINDTLNGVFRTYYQNKVISSFGIYKKGKMIGNWYYFDEKGFLNIEVSKLEYKGYSVKKEKDLVKYSTKSFIKIFYKNGGCKEEGFAIYDDVELEIEKIGVWKYYDENDKTIKSAN
jgi:antitoxin component YwqK of YwqJK toxin-antitoxin module